MQVRPAANVGASAVARERSQALKEVLSPGACPSAFDSSGAAGLKSLY